METQFVMNFLLTGLKVMERPMEADGDDKCLICKMPVTSDQCFDAHACHVTEEKDRKVFECQICRQKLCNKSKMRRHVWRHMGYKPLQCPQCPFKSDREDKLELHFSRTHTGE